MTPQDSCERCTFNLRTEDSGLQGLPGGSGDKVPTLGREDPLEKEMAAHSSVLAWEIPLTEEPGGLQSMRSHRVGHDLATKQQGHTLRLKAPCVQLDAWHLVFLCPHLLAQKSKAAFCLVPTCSVLFLGYGTDP